MAVLRSSSPPFPFSLREFPIVSRLSRVVPLVPFTALLPSLNGSQSPNSMGIATVLRFHFLIVCGPYTLSRVCMSNAIKRRVCVLLGRIWLGCRLGIKRSTAPDPTGSVSGYSADRSGQVNRECS